jgi:ribosome biogenesis GTPase A
MGERTFAKERDRLRDSLGNLADLADERESPAVAEAARALDKKLVENRSNVVVLGEFKRGKTTFVNALVGAEMLPSAVVPLTSIVTTVAHGEPARARIDYLDGREENVSLSDLARYVTERHDPANQRAVRRAVLSYPSEALRDGVVFLIDTPGVRSVFRHNTEATREFPSEADLGARP